MGQIKRIIGGILVVFILAAGSFFIWIYTNHVTPILMYHKVQYSVKPDAEKVSPQLFEKHMNMLKRWGFKVVSLDDLVNTLAKGQNLPRNHVVITFDDGFLDNYTNAFPVLKKYGYPATIFIPSDHVNLQEYLTVQQIKEMKPYGVDIGSHTRFHTYLPKENAQKKFDEIFRSKTILEEKLGFNIDYFAYPVGGYDDESKRLVRQAGYKGAVTTNRGFDPKNKDIFELNRVRLSNSDNNSLYMWVKFAGYANVFKKGKNPY